MNSYKPLFSSQAEYRFTFPSRHIVNSNRALKQWSLAKNETINTFEAWTCLFHFVNRQVVMINNSSALALIYLQRTVLFCLGFASCLPLTTKILPIWIIRPLSSRPKMNTIMYLSNAVSRRVSTKQSPHFKAFYKHYPIQLTLDTGAETNIIKSSLAHFIGAPITKSSQQALRADGLTPLAVDGETRLILSRADKHLALDALVVDDLDVDVIAGAPFFYRQRYLCSPC